MAIPKTANLARKTTKPEKAETPSKEATIRMNINLPKSFHKQIKQKALDQDISVTDLVIKALNIYLDKY